MYLRKYVNKIVLISTIAASVCLLGSQAYGDTLPTSTPAAAQNIALIPLEIVPECSDSQTASALWNVTNSNTANVPIGWTNIDNGQSGTFSAPAGESSLVTYFDTTDPNNTTQFTYEGMTTSTNATEAACVTAPITNPAPTPVMPTQVCIDGTIQQNLTVTWVNPSTVTVQTLHDEPLCSAITIDFSSYVMPSNYDGTGFYRTYDMNDPANNVPNPTAFPQTIFDNQSATLAAGTDGLTTLTINLPATCDNAQVDVYYAPELTTLGPTGNGTANIVSNIYPATTTCPCPAAPVTTNPSTPPVPAAPVTTTPNNGNGGMGAGSPAATTAAVTPNPPVTTPAPAELANTGQPLILPYLAALSLLVPSVALRLASRRHALNQ
jgi:hypothetical protein